MPELLLDSLGLDTRAESGPVPVKIDVEGAEMEVPQGAEEMLRMPNVTWSISVRPGILPNYGHTADDVASFMRDRGSLGSLLAVDHEEHWWYARPDGVGVR